MQSDNILCVISARGGSKGVPCKNIRPILGRPLIVWAIEKALSVTGIRRVIVSTDSEDIARVARAVGAEVPFMRPAFLASSDAGKFQVWQHALKACEQQENVMYDLYLDIDCTNPLLEVADIEGTLQKFRQLQLDNARPDAVFTISEARCNPYFNLVEQDSDGVLRVSKHLDTGTVLARQRAPAVYEHVAGAYILATQYLRSASHLLDGRAFGYQVPPDRALDIDTELDFAIAEFLLRRQLAAT